MAHFAKIENDIVTRVIRIDDEHEQNGHYYINTVLKLKGEWVQTSYNGKIRKRFAGIGDTYDRENDVFIRPKPYPSWVLNEEFKWIAPIPYPNQPLDYTATYEWIEDVQGWLEHKEEDIEQTPSGSF